MEKAREGMRAQDKTWQDRTMAGKLIACSSLDELQISKLCHRSNLWGTCHLFVNQSKYTYLRIGIHL